eukprot:gene16565-biopygen20296
MSTNANDWSWTWPYTGWPAKPDLRRFRWGACAGSRPARPKGSCAPEAARRTARAPAVVAPGPFEAGARLRRRRPCRRPWCAKLAVRGSTPPLLMGTWSWEMYRASGKEL